MDHFPSLFGIPRNSVRRNCMLLPFLPPKTLEIFGIKELSRGKLFSSASTSGITIIKTGLSAGMVGDAVLYLQDTACENIFFMGSCGSINKEQGLKIGNLVLPSAAYALDSFNDILHDRLTKPVAVHPDQNLHTDFLKTTATLLPTGACVSFASLHEEEKHLKLFRELKADVIDMECAAFFSAARKAGRKALALLYISDILEETRFFEELSPENAKNLSEGIRQAATTIQTFMATA